MTGSSAANVLAEKADVVLSVGSRLQDFTTGSNGLIKGQVIALNVQAHDLTKHEAMPLMADARAGLEAIAAACADNVTAQSYRDEVASLRQGWADAVDAVCGAPEDGNHLQTDRRSSVLSAVPVRQRRLLRCRRINAWRAAQALAGWCDGWLSYGIWLFLHGV